MNRFIKTILPLFLLFISTLFLGSNSSQKQISNKIQIDDSNRSLISENSSDDSYEINDLNLKSKTANKLKDVDTSSNETSTNSIKKDKMKISVDKFTALRNSKQFLEDDNIEVIIAPEIKHSKNKIKLDKKTFLNSIQSKDSSTKSKVSPDQNIKSDSKGLVDEQILDINEDMRLKNRKRFEAESSQVEDMVEPDFDEGPMLLDLDEQEILIKNFKKLSGTQIEENYKILVNKDTINITQFYKENIYNQLFTGLMITRYFYNKKNISSQLIEQLSVFKCNLKFKTLDREYEGFTISKNKKKKKIRIVKEKLVLIERDRPLDPKNAYQLTYDRVHKFNTFYGEFCQQLETFLEPLRTLLYEFKSKEFEDSSNKSIGLNSFLGIKIDKLIRKTEKSFNQFITDNSGSNEEILQYVKNIDCNLKDMMAFYDLLPRFLLLFRRIKVKLEEEEDPVILYYREKLLEIHGQWLENNNNLFKYIAAFNFWMMMQQSIFKMPFSFPIDDFFKISMIEMMSKAMIDLTVEKERFRTAIKNSISTYKKIYEELHDFFEGLEEHMYIKVPFNFPTLENRVSIFSQNLSILAFVIILLTNVD